MRLRSWRCVVLRTPLIDVKFCSGGTCACEIGNQAKGSDGSTLQIGKGGRSSRVTSTRGRRADESHYASSPRGTLAAAIARGNVRRPGARARRRCYLLHAPFAQHDLAKAVGGLPVIGYLHITRAVKESQPTGGPTRSQPLHTHTHILRYIGT
eukprot:5280975-Prymnesium_polylepis.1